MRSLATLRGIMPRQPKSRSYVFTLNNPTVDDYWQELPDGITYMVWQVEHPEGGTRHFQGALQLKGPRTISWVKNKLQTERIHLEKREGNWEQAIGYSKKCCSLYKDPEHSCLKERKEGPWELGETPKQGKRKDVDDVKEAIKAGKTDLEIANEFFSSWVKYNKAFTLYRQMLIKGREHDDPWYCINIQGAPGLGKSYYAHYQLALGFQRMGFKGVYHKPPQTKWWCGYEGQEIIIMDDMDGSWFPYRTLLKLMDKYPMHVEPKGQAYIPYAAKVVITTSNDQPEGWYDRDTSALVRRFTHRIVFHSARMPVYTKGTPLAFPDPEADELIVDQLMQVGHPVLLRADATFGPSDVNPLAMSTDSYDPFLGTPTEDDDSWIMTATIINDSVESEEE